MEKEVVLSESKSIEERNYFKKTISLRIFALLFIYSPFLSIFLSNEINASQLAYYNTSDHLSNVLSIVIKAIVVLIFVNAGFAKIWSNRRNFLFAWIPFVTGIAALFVVVVHKSIMTHQGLSMSLINTKLLWASFSFGVYIICITIPLLVKETIEKMKTDKSWVWMFAIYPIIIFSGLNLIFQGVEFNRVFNNTGLYLSLLPILFLGMAMYGFYYLIEKSVFSEILHRADQKRSIIVAKYVFYVITIHRVLFLLFAGLSYVYFAISHQPLELGLTGITQVMSQIGVAGVIGAMGGSVTLFLFPFAPLVVEMFIIFGFVYSLERKGIITEHIRIFFVFVFVSLIFFTGVLIHDIATRQKSTAVIDNQRSTYESKYETSEAVKADSSFIYSKAGGVFVGGANRNEGKKSYQTDFKNIGYVSPGGTYYVSCDPQKQHGDCTTLRSKDNKEKSVNLCVMGSEKSGSSCPSFCQWNAEGSRIVCKYDTGSTFPEMTYIYFNPVNGAYKVIAKKTGFELLRDPNADNDVVQDFAFSDNNSVLYTDHGIFFQINNLDVAENEIQKVQKQNLSYCNGFIYYNTKIFCVVNAETYNIKIEDSDNFFVRSRTEMIISQSLDQIDKDAFSVVSKAPLDPFNFMYPFGDSIMYVLSNGSLKIINIESGRSRNIGGFLDGQNSRFVDSDHGLILDQTKFANDEVGIDHKKIPIRYNEKGDAVAPVGVISQTNTAQNTNKEVLSGKQTKWENDRISFEYDANEFIVEDMQRGMVHLKDKQTGLGYASIFTYATSGDSTFDKLFSDLKKLEGTDGYEDVLKVKIGNREFVEHSSKQKDGRVVTLDYEIIINNAYYLRVGENFSYHIQNEESMRKLEKIIETMWVKNY